MVKCAEVMDGFMHKSSLKSLVKAWDLFLSIKKNIRPILKLEIGRQTASTLAIVEAQAPPQANKQSTLLGREMVRCCITGLFQGGDSREAIIEIKTHLGGIRHVLR